MTTYELSVFRKSVGVSLNEAARASGVSRTRLWYAERGAASLSDAERAVLIEHYTAKAKERVTRLSQVFGGSADVNRGMNAE
jgi:transcriptional regulator with XRE-family HTH domain